MSEPSVPSFDELRDSTLAALQRMERELAGKRRRVEIQVKQVERLEERVAALKGELSIARKARTDAQNDHSAHVAEMRQQRVWLTLVNEKLGRPDDDPFPESEAGTEDAGNAAPAVQEQQAPPASALSLNV